MTVPDFATVRAAVLEARTHTGQARIDHLAALASADVALHDAVVSLLAHDDAPSPFLDDGLHPDGPGALLARALAARDDGGPQTIGPYELEGRIGEGGMGVVYRARQTEPLVREVALKRLRVGLDAPRAIARFEAEAHALARVHHPHIAAVYDAGVDPTGRPYLVMELIDGVPITAWAQTHHAPLHARIGLFLQVADAVRHAHQRGLIHRDLKPSNLLVTMVDGAPVAKVIDFGIAKAIEPDGTDALTLVDQVVGTPAYMSPEQAGAFGGEVDTRTDVYALGVVLYELLCGERPHLFPSLLPEDIRQVLASGTVRPPSRVVDQDGPVAARALRGDLDVIALQALRYEPDRRYGSVEQLADDLRRHLAGLPVLARGDGWAYRSGRFVRRHWQAVGAASVLAVTLITATGILAVQADQLRDERNRAVAAEAEAVREAQTATGVTDFLVQLFELADPNDARGEELTAREVLDLGVARIHEAPPDDPEVTARLLIALGDTYISLGAYEQARPLVAEALALREAALGPDHPDVAEALGVLATVEHDLGDLDASLAHQRRQVAIRRVADGNDSVHTAEALNGLAVTLDGMGAYPEAEAAYREALAIQRRVLGDEDPELAWSLSTLGQVRYRQGAWVEADALFAEALERLRRANDPQPFDLGSVLNNVAGSRLALDDVDGAAAAWTEALAVFRGLYPDSHPAVGRALVNLSRALLAGGDVEGALTTVRPAVASQTAALGEGHALTGSAHASLGQALIAAGDLDGAQTELQTALSVWTDALGPEHSSTLGARRDLVRLAQARGDRDAVRQGHEALLAAWTSTASADHPNLARARLEVALDRLADGDSAGAAALVALARPALAALPPTHSLDALADGLSARIDGDAAALDAALQRLVARYGARDPWVTGLQIR